jgi:hypothetical protein
MSQALVDKISNEVIGDFVTIDLKKLEFIKHLAQLEATAKVAAKRVESHARIQAALGASPLG